MIIKYRCQNSEEYCNALNEADIDLQSKAEFDLERGVFKFNSFSLYCPHCGGENVFDFFVEKEEK